ncbi:MAG TPA: trypsin-like peptidase domain-containing protein, partial [Gemmatimonadaceae bacterium]
HGTSDLRFDPHADLDVSTRHAELHVQNGVWRIVDQASTNGTYVNGVRVSGSKALKDGDVINFGVNGPRVEVHLGGSGAAPATRLSPGIAGIPLRTASGRVDTGVRVAIAVNEQTRAMRRLFAGVIAVVVLAGAAGLVWSQRRSASHEAELNALIAHGDSVTAALQKTIASMRPADSALRASLEAQLAKQRSQMASARELVADGKGTVEELSRRLGPVPEVARMDFARVSELNDAAVAMIASDFDGNFLAGTAFGVTPSGLLMTNRHVVRTEGGKDARRVMVIFANTKAWLPAKIVRASDTDDLALLQIDVPGSYPVVAGVSKAGGLARVGAAVASIGYPGATDTPMEGSGMKITARTTITAGTVSKRLDDVLQIDSYAGHGSSGSPVFDAAGTVVGVIYGGARESNGRIVYAIPAQRVAAFLGSEGSAIIR